MVPSLESLGIDALSVEERIELVGLIWDSVADSGEDHPVPEWHLEVIEQRLQAADADLGGVRPWADVKARLTGTT